MASDARLPERSLLQEHTAFLRRLAFSLLRDEHAAADVVQQSFLAALERKERPRNLRAWLAAVTRNLSLSALRARRNRVRREKAAARREPLPPPDEGIARLELQRRVVDAVLGLDEPYRSAIVYRFFHELRLKEIGRHLGVPAATVRTRVRRGLERLRARLDADHGGQRRAWAVLLLPLMRPPPPPVGAGAGKALVATGCAAMLVAGLWWSWRREPTPSAPPVAPAPVADPAAAPPDTAPAEEPPPEPRPPRGPTTPPAPEEPKEARPEPPPLIEVKEDPPAPPAPKRQAAPLRPARPYPGFVEVPAGPLRPGCTLESFRQRATNERLAAALYYEVWGRPPALAVPGFFQGRYEVTNAQWKHYLDARFRTRFVTTGHESLAAVAQRLAGTDSEWGAVYALNAEAVRAALQEGFPLDDPPERIRHAPLPANLALVTYRCRVPRPWYGWCRASHVLHAREFVDARAPAADAFRPPAGLGLRADDFAAHPVRGVAAAEMLAFAEWAGCHLPSEYEFERSVRYDRTNAAQYPFDGAWDRAAHPGLFAWADNPRCAKGPLRVDDESVAGGDTRFGARHVLGNVWELTRTFFDSHPDVTPAPPVHDLANYALTAKGGAWGDGWRFVQVSTRTPRVGLSLDLRTGRRPDTVGLRLVRHAAPGRDLLSHSIRRLVYDVEGADWRRPFPHEFALARAAGHDVLDWAAADAPYVHVRGPARGIAFAPRWQAELSAQRLRDVKRDAREYVVLGVLRSDVAMRAGVRLTEEQAADLRRARDEYESARRRGKAEGAPPPPPDAYEKATVRREKRIGLWRERAIGPGEWLVVAWQDFIGLLDASRLVPPAAILLAGAPERMRGAAGAASVDVDLAGGAVALRFAVEEPSDERGARPAPDERRSELWAMCEVEPNGWPGRVPGDHAWQWRVEFEADLDQLR